MRISVHKSLVNYALRGLGAKSTELIVTLSQLML